MVPALTTLLEQVETKVRQTRRRQILQQALVVLPLCLTMGFLVGVLAAILFPLLGVTVPAWSLGTAALALGLTAALVWAVGKRPSAMGAALALDRAFGLQERIVTMTSLTAAQRQSEASTLLARQMQEQLQSVNVPQGFPLPATRRAWLAPAGAALVLVLALLFPSVWSLSSRSSLANLAAERTAKDAEKKSIDVKEFKLANENRKKRLKEIGSETLNELQHEIDELLQKVEQAKEGSAESKLALEDITKLTEKIRQHETARDKLEEMKKHLKLEIGDKIPTDKGPAQEFTKALSKADFEKAREEMMKLAEKMQKGEMSKEEMKELAKQMSNLKSKLEEIAQQKEKLEALEKSNLDPETKQKEREKIEKELEKLKDLADLAQQMKEAADQMEKGDKDAAREAMEKMAEQLQKLEMGEQEAGELQIAEGDLDALKAAIAGMKGKGAGKRGKNKGDPWGGDKDWSKEGENNPNGRGSDPTEAAVEGGMRDETLDKTKSEDTTAQGKSNPSGKMTVVGTGPKQGKPGKDLVKNRLELSPAELDQAKQQASEALKQQKISQTQRDVVTDFYKNLAPSNGEKK
jgi:myosin heavy subunit